MNLTLSGVAVNAIPITAHQPDLGRLFTTTDLDCCQECCFCMIMPGLHIAYTTGNPLEHMTLRYSSACLLLSWFGTVWLPLLLQNETSWRLCSQTDKNSKEEVRRQQLVHDALFYCHGSDSLICHSNEWLHRCHICIEKRDCIFTCCCPMCYLLYFVYTPNKRKWEPYFPTSLESFHLFANIHI